MHHEAALVQELLGHIADLTLLLFGEDRLLLFCLLLYDWGGHIRTSWSWCCCEWELRAHTPSAAHS